MCRLHKLNFRRAKKTFEFVSKGLFVYNRDVVRFVDYDGDYVITHLWGRGLGSKSYHKSYALS